MKTEDLANRATQNANLPKHATLEKTTSQTPRTEDLPNRATQNEGRR
jgi:hypothetical protein